MKTSVGIGISPVYIPENNGEEPIGWLLRDEFTTPRAAGSVNGTATEPGPGTRKDVNNNLAITGGKLVLDSATDIYYLTDAITRAVGRTIFTSLDAAAAGDFDIIQFGVDDATTAVPDRNVIQLGAATVLKIIENGGTAINVDNYSGITALKFAIILRATGFYSFWYNGTIWKLLYIGSVNNTATLYGGIGAVTTAPAANVDFYRYPDVTILPTPLAYDSFTRADGALGSTETTGPDGQSCTARSWVTTTGVVDTNQMKVVPTLGAELLVNSDFSAWTGDNPDGWTVTGESGVDPEVSEVGAGEGHGGTGTGYCNIYTTSAAVQISQTPLTAGNLYRSSIVVNTVIAGGLSYNHNGTTQTFNVAPGTSMFTLRATGTDLTIRRRTGNDNATLQSASIKQINLASCLAAVTDSTTRNVYPQVEITCTDNTQAGLMIGLDSQTTPLNYLHIYINRVDAKIYVDSVTAGAVTNISAVAFTYAAGATLAVRHDGTNLYVWYNNAYVSNSATPMPGSGTLVACFATDSGTRFDNFLVYPTTGYTEFDKYVA